jgi:hypothetical protein
VGPDRAAQRNAPAFGSPGRTFQPQIREDRGLINVNGDLLGAALGGDMLGARQRRPATLTGKPDKIVRNERYRAPRAPLPGRVRRRVDDNLAHHSPTSMARIATRNKKPGQCIGHQRSSRLGSVIV